MHRRRRHRRTPPPRVVAVARLKHRRATHGGASLAGAAGVDALCQNKITLEMTRTVWSHFSIA
eukprot:6928442-Prymnesium_polylepis.1